MNSVFSAVQSTNLQLFLCPDDCNCQTSDCLCWYYPHLFPWLTFSSKVLLLQGHEQERFLDQFWITAKRYKKKKLKSTIYWTWSLWYSDKFTTISPYHYQGTYDHEHHSPKVHFHFLPHKHQCVHTTCTLPFLWPCHPHQLQRCPHLLFAYS